MKINKNDILLVIVILLAGYSILQMRGIRTDVAGYNAKIDSIQNEIDSIDLVNKEITNQILAIDKEIDNIDGDIDKVTNNITIIKKQTDEKVKAVNEFTFSDLAKFFADRYEGRENDSTGHDSSDKSSNR